MHRHTHACTHAHIDTCTHPPHATHSPPSTLPGAPTARGCMWTWLIASTTRPGALTGTGSDTQTRHTDTRPAVFVRVCVVGLLLKVCGGAQCALLVECVLSGWCIYARVQCTLRALSILTTYSYHLTAASVPPATALLSWLHCVVLGRARRLRSREPGFFEFALWVSFGAGQTQCQFNCHQNYLLQKSRLCYLSFGND